MIPRLPDTSTQAARTAYTPSRSDFITTLSAPRFLSILFTVAKTIMMMQEIEGGRGTGRGSSQQMRMDDKLPELLSLRELPVDDPAGE